MFEQRTAVFLINLTQDVNVLRPLIYMAARDFGFQVLILVSPQFRARDHLVIWESELELICSETRGRLVAYGSDFEAFRELQGTGVIFSASEFEPDRTRGNARHLQAGASFLSESDASARLRMRRIPAKRRA